MSLKRWGLVSLALTGTLWALLATPYDGPWTGTNSAGRAVSFTVSGTGTAWTVFSYGISFSCPQVGTVTTAISQSGPGAITDGEFSYSSPTLAFTGSFDSPTSASGTYTLNNYPVIHGLGFPPYIHTDYITLSGTWTAGFSGSLNSLELTAPNGGETWAAGSTHDITWTSLGEIANVALEYSANGGTDWTTIAATTPNSGSYPWTLPGSPSATGLVRVSDAAAPTIFDTGDAVFSIVQAIPASERQALIALYNATTGDSWSDNHGWKTPPLALDGFAMPGTEETWAGVTVDVANSTVTQLNLIYQNLSGSIPSEIGNLEGLQYLDLSGNSLTGSIPTGLGGLTHLSYLGLYSNQLSGAIPGELGDLASLQTLMLFQNQLSGPIPAELGGLTSLSILHLGENQLSGAIPSALSGLVAAQQVILSSNRLTGPIPPGLGGMANLMYLYLNGNQLSGPIPTSLTGMVSLEPGGLNLGYNALYASDPDLVAFLDSKNPGWASTQTVTPIEMTATALDGARILVSWLPIAYTADAGSYRIFSSLDPGGPYSAAGQTADKSASSAEVSGLTPGETYYFVVRAHTDAHANNPNAVESEDSSEVSAVAWIKLNPRIAGVVRVGGSPLPGVVMSGLNGSPVTDSNGAYDVTVAAGWSGTVTPTLAGYTFDPAFRAYSVLNDDQLVQDYAATQITFTVSGSVTVGATGLAGVTMSGLPGNPVTDASGDYSGMVTPGWSGTVTPTLASYTFDPVSQLYTNVNANMSSQDYSASLIATPQRQALIAFYNSTNGDGWSNNSGWKTPPLYPDGFALPGTEGTWFGVGLDEGLQVIQLSYQGNNTTGSLPSALANLPALQVLSIMDSPLSGPIPAELGSLTSLNTLRLANNQLTGAIPPELGGLPNLQYLDLYLNQLTGSIPAELGGLTNLVQIRIHNNQLNGAIPSELGSLSNLVYLGLFSNSLTGAIPPELANMSNLQILALSHNQLSGTIPSGLGGLTHLMTLDLDHNQIGGAIPAELGNLTDLMILWLGANQLTGPIPPELGNLVHLQWFHLNGNKLTGAIPASLANLTALISTPSVTDIGYNALYTTDEALITFLNSKDADWAATQTIAPADVTATSLDNAVIMVSWLPVTYTADAGYYQILMSDTLGGPYSLVGQTTDKATSSLNVTSLTPGQRYYFVVRTVTNAHTNNTNIVESGNSAEATTVAWTQINVQITGTILAGGLPLANVLMAGLPGTVVTNAAGVYDASVAAGSSPTVTPTLEGYSFVPVSRAYTTVTEDQIAQDYAATEIVAPTITVVSPNGGEIWYAGTAHDITWTSTGTIPNIKLEYSTNGGANWAPIVESTPNTAVYPWTVPMLGSTTGIVKASAAGDPGIYDTSNAAFTIDTFTLTYTAGAGGTISGTTPQEVAYGGNGTEVTAVPNAGYHFVSWSDGVLTTSRTDLNVIGDISATATFAIDTIPVTERAALIALYDATDGDNWTNNSGWKTPPLHTDGFAMPGTEGSWFGISMDAGTLHVMYIHLEHNNLSGTIPAGLSQLTGLIYLNLEANPLSGTIPDELGSLPQLQQLWLRSDHLTGSIPASLGNLTHLYILGLSSNQLSGSIPPELGNLTTNLAFLYLDNNQLSGSIPAELGQITILFTLDLQSNHLSGPIPPELGNFLYLRGLFLHSNQLSGTIPAELGNLASLEYLVINSNQLSGAIPTSLVNLTNLKNGFSKLGYNALHTSDADLIAFLNVKDPNWASTQTIAPTGNTATALDNAVIMVSWLPVTYTTDAGHYNVYISQTAGGPYTLAGETTDKATTAVNVTGLTPGQSYYFVVRTVTNAHANNTSAVESENSTEASAIAGTQINVQITGTILAGGLPLANVLMAGLPGTVVTNASGVYDASVAAGSSPTVTPTLEGYSFVPESRAYPTITEDQIAQDYAATEIVAPTITVVSPNGGEIWYAGTSHDITWTSTGTIPNIKLEYSTNGGASWAPIVESTPNTAVYPWTVPMLGSTTGIVKASAAGDPGIYDTSDAAFTINTFTLTYTAGAGGTISGTTPQEVAYGGNGTEVTAVPNVGYHFVSWSDGGTTASRTDTNVTADITVTANFALGDSPYDGPWTGTNSEGRTVSLTVSGGGTAWSSFGYAIQFSCPAIGGTVSTTITQSGPGAITNGTFSYSSGTLAFTGTFGSPTTASGTYTLTNYPVIHGLPGPPFVHTDYITYSGTWTATFGGTIPTVTVTSPNGGESWALGTAHAVTWTQTDLTGTVTIDLYKGGVYQKTLGTPDATAGTFSWVIATNETPGTDYRVLVWQGSVSDDSDGDFTVRKVKVDFNRDGQEDILWRYYGEGGYNRAWFLGDSAPAGMPLIIDDSRLDAGGAKNRFPADGAINSFDGSQGAPAAAQERGRKNTLRSPRNLMGDISGSPAGSATVRDPRLAGGLNPNPPPAGISDPRQIGRVLDRKTRSDVPTELAALPVLLGGGDVLPVNDLSWQIVGTGDFNNDTHVDILWRNSSSGSNVVWFMNGTDWAGSTEIMPVGDLSWKIVGTGDFNNDTHVDILWRNTSSGENVVWYMNGTDWAGSSVLLGVSDQNWQIVGTGDFNGDGNVDLLWRYNGAGGYNVVWYLDNTTWTGSAELIPVADISWQIVGTGDYNKDGSIDILWRYNGAGGYNVIWYMNGVAWSESAELLPVNDLTWRIVSR